MLMALYSFDPINLASFDETMDRAYYQNPDNSDILCASEYI